MNLLLRVFLLETVYQMQLGADGPLRAGRGGFDRFDDLPCGTALVGQFKHFARALGMHQDLDAGVLFSEHGNMLRLEHLMHAAVAFPEDYFAAVESRFVVATQVVGKRIPDWHLLFGAHFSVKGHPQRRVAAQVLVGEEHHATGASEGPVESRFGVARRADDSAMSANERFEARG